MAEDEASVTGKVDVEDESFNAKAIAAAKQFVINRPSWWTKLCFLIALYNLALVPFRICLMVQASLAEAVVDLLLDAVMAIEFLGELLKVPRGHSDETEICVQNMFINIRRRESTFELCALIPLDLVGLAVSDGLLHPIFRLNKMTRAVELGWYFDQLGKILQISNNAQQIFRFSVTILWFVYWMGCVWNLVVSTDGEIPFTWYWTQNPGITDKPASFRFLIGIYWTLTMMTGYGSILPQSDLQVAYSLFTAVIGVAGNVGAIGTLGSLVQNLDSSGAAFRQKMDAVNDYMRYRKFSTEMQNRIKEYYTYLWQTRRGLDEGSLIRELPDYLQEEVSLFLNKEIISKVPLFHECDEQFKSAVVVKLIPTVLLPESFIVRKGEVGREMYFISRGEVQVVSDAKEKSERVVYATLRDGSFFGEVALLFNDSRRTATVVTSSYCDLFVLTKEDFDTIQESFPDQSKAIMKAASKRYKLQQENVNAEDNDK
ncbi:Cyclic nucleotide-gated cation channel [Diplonema papillatum]|nr:Cyclic nucleotide-gated cation channel [Diplonema papillatum]